MRDVIFDYNLIFYLKPASGRRAQIDDFISLKTVYPQVINKTGDSAA